MTENVFVKKESQNQFRRKQIGELKPKGPTSLQTKLDSFIQNSLNYYEFCEINPKFVQNATMYSKHLFNYKSLIPDLVIYNKTFNKNQCFVDANPLLFNPYPRTKFVLNKRYQSSNLNGENKEFYQETKEFEETEDADLNYKQSEEIQWENVDAKELADVKVSFQAIPKKLAELKIENSNIDFLANNNHDELQDTLEKNLEAIFEIDSKKDNSLCNKTNPTDDKDAMLNNSNNQEDKINEDDLKKEKFSLFSDLSLFNRNTSSDQNFTQNLVQEDKITKEVKNNIEGDKNFKPFPNFPNMMENLPKPAPQENAKIFENFSFLENPVALIKKNLLAKHWFVTRNERLYNCFTSYELYKFLDNEIGKKKDLNQFWIFDNETDIHFTANAIYDVLKENIHDLMKEMQTNFQQNNMKKQMMMGVFPPPMMISPRTAPSTEPGKLPAIPQNMPVFQPFPPQIPFMPHPMFMPMPPGNFMMMNFPQMKKEMENLNKENGNISGKNSNIQEKSHPIKNDKL